MNVGINALDGMDSILWSHANGMTHDFAYSPFGSKSASRDDDGVLPGFNGQRLDPASQGYHLGNGYRSYKPGLLRFNAPDSWSPFGHGGLNQYAYCEGDPINRSDPSGHMSTGSAVRISLGIFWGVLGVVFSCGASIIAEGAITAGFAAMSGVDRLVAGLGAASTLAGAMSGGTRESDPELSRVFSWLSFGLGAASLGVKAADAMYGNLMGRSGSYDLSRSVRGGGSGVGAASDVSAEKLGAQKLGERFYLFKGSDSLNSSDRLIVTAHGVQDKYLERVKVPAHSCHRLFCPEGTSLAHSYLYKAAKNMYPPVDIIDGGETVTKYFLSKFDEDTYQEISDLTKQRKVDILTIRHRRGRKEVSNADIFSTLEDAGIHYPYIDGLHCRSVRGGKRIDYVV